MTRPLPEIVLDLSRLVSRVGKPTPTGVDRVELSYARELLRTIPDRLMFGAVHPVGGYGRIARRDAVAFLDAVEAAWSGGPQARGVSGWRAVGDALWRLRPRPVPPALGPRVLVQSSPHHLDKERLVARILRAERARLVCLLHDLIPIEFPEYARPGGAALHGRRMRTVARQAHAVIANSKATQRAFLPHLHAEGRMVPVAVAHLGLTASLSRAAPQPRSARPYFVCLGTIEPRKNHLLLLHIWREMAARLGPAAVPRLLVIGRRGWENEQVVDLLERCPALVGCVEEHARVSDHELQTLLGGARALLLPSFAEGFGMPVPEALGLGVPVLCSDLPALREAGGDMAIYLDPLDGPAWREAILTLADEPDEAYARRRHRLLDWQGPTWEDHLRIVVDLADRVAADGMPA
jgi:glycosyltransferase involved in cell wall biosynthesis